MAGFQVLLLTATWRARGRCSMPSRKLHIPRGFILGWLIRCVGSYFRKARTHSRIRGRHVNTLWNDITCKGPLNGLRVGYILRTRPCTQSLKLFRSRVLLTARAFIRPDPSARWIGRLSSDFLKSGVVYSVVTNALFLGRVEKGSSWNVRFYYIVCRN